MSENELRAGDKVRLKVTKEQLLKEIPCGDVFINLEVFDEDGVGEVVKVTQTGAVRLRDKLTDDKMLSKGLLDEVHTTTMFKSELHLIEKIKGEV